MPTTAPLETLTRAADAAGSASALAKALDYDRAKRERLYRALRGEVQKVGHDLVADAERYLTGGGDGGGALTSIPSENTWPTTWSEVCVHPLLRDLPFKVEQDRYGRILMSPPPAPRHGRRQVKICRLMEDALGGEAFVECAIDTVEGTKVPDAVWMSDGFAASIDWSKASLDRAPEICVEVMSPSNLWAEMEEKVTLYLAKGAQEVWICEPDGRLRFFGHEGERERSVLVPDAPATVEL